MKRTQIHFFPTLIGLLLLSFITFSVQASKKDKIPRKIRKSYELLANHLTNGMHENQQKADTIYGWITHNIRYDYKRLSDDKYYSYEAANKTLKKKKGLSMEMAQLLTLMLDEVGITATQVDGYLMGRERGDSLVLNRTSHEWVVAQIDGEWYMMDPTLDAGYIGKIPIEYKVPKKRTPVFLKTAKRKTRFEKRYQIKYKRYLQKIEEGSNFKEEIDFIPLPERTFFMPEMDSFLLTHLPAVEYWQLRKTPISAEDFLKSEEELLRHLANHSGDYDYEEEIQEYLSLSQIDQLIRIADQGYQFNPKNPGLKAVNYYNYINVLSSKELKPYFSGVPDQYSSAIYNQMLVFVDTVSTYCKLDYNQQKGTFKKRKSMLSDTYKSTTAANKVINKQAKKGYKYHGKTLALLEKTDVRLNSNNDKIEADVNKMEEKYPEVFGVGYETPESKPIQAWVDSISLKVMALDSVIDAVTKHQENSTLKQIYKGVQETEYLMRVSSNYISQNDLGVNRYIKEVDTLIILELDSLNQFYAAMGQFELIDKQLMEFLKEIKYFMKMSRMDAKKLMNEGKIVSNVTYDRYMNYLYLQELEKVHNFNQKIQSHIEWMDDNFGFVEANWEKIIKNVDQQEVLNEEKNEYMQSYYEHDFNRGKSLYTEMMTSAKTWKKELKKILEDY